MERSPVIMKVANTWLILNEGGGPTDDKPDVVLETPPDPHRTSAFLNIRVADIAALRRLAAEGGSVPHRTQRSRPRDPRLCSRPRWSPDRGWPVHWHARRDVSTVL